MTALTETQRLIREAAAKLAKAGQPDTARLDAELLAAHLAGTARDVLLLGASQHSLDSNAYDALLARRLAGEPLAYITGEVEFWSLELHVTPDTLIPRGDSETLIELALAQLPGTPGHILDLGTGSGCLLLAALSEYEAAQGLGIDASPQALIIAEQNAERLGFGRRARFQRGDWCEGLMAEFDLILCNPPYVDRADMLGPGVREYEPSGALFAGGNGLDDYRTILPQLSRHLSSDGLAVLEIGARQGDDVREIAAASKLAFVASRNDLGGHERALCFRRAQD